MWQTSHEKTLLGFRNSSPRRAIVVQLGMGTSINTNPQLGGSMKSNPGHAYLNPRADSNATVLRFLFLRPPFSVIADYVIEWREVHLDEPPQLGTGSSKRLIFNAGLPNLFVVLQFNRRNSCPEIDYASSRTSY